MGLYHCCPNSGCTNDDEGDIIWSCGDCGKVHCEKCDGDGGTCPDCGSDNMKTAGNIVAGYSGDGDGNLDEDEYDHCERCDNIKDGDKIWKCNNCGCLHCESCDPDNSTCPNCGDDSVTAVGNIHHGCENS